MTESTHPIANLSALVRRLRGPDGCPWDREQRLVDLRAYLLEEAHEVAAAIDSGDWTDLRGELGDLLFHIVFIAELADEENAFDLKEVSREIEAKMIARHPHVFGAEPMTDATDVHRAWEQRKLSTKAPSHSILDGLPDSLPSLLTAYRMTQKAAGVGFDWPDVTSILDKVDEELGELRQELDGGVARPGRQEAVFEEIGDLLLTIANLSRRLEIDPEAALASSNRKFRRRFRALEQAFDDGPSSLPDATTEEMESVWQRVKDQEQSR